MIVLDDVTVTTSDGVVLLSEVSLRLAERRIGVIGANGSGKTTLARLLNGLSQPTSGHVSVGDLDATDDRAEVQRRVGFVFQDADHQLVYPTPLEDVALGLRARGLGRVESRAAASAALERLGLAAKADQAIHTLSGGEKHLVALCGVLALEPDWIVLDEPTTTLDIVNRRQVVQALDQLDQRLVIVSHDLDLVAQMDRVIVLSAGRVVGDGAPVVAIDRYRTLVGAG